MKRIIWFCPILSGILFGMLGLFAKPLAAAGINNFSVVESRMSLSAAILFFAILIVNRNLFKISPKDLLIVIIASICGLTLVNLFYNYAINELTMSLAAVMISLSPIFTLLLASVFFKEKLTKRKILIACVAIAGCICASGILENGIGNVTILGLIFGLLAGLFYSIYTMFIKLISDKGYSGITITFYSILTISITLFAFCDWMSIRNYVAVDPVSHALFLLSHSLFATVIPYVLYNFALGRMDSGIASILSSAEPVAAMVFGIIIYHDRISIFSFLGLIFMFGALSALSLEKS